jgi:OmpA-OmpF porin, OOP family
MTMQLRGSAFFVALLVLAWAGAQAQAPANAGKVVVAGVVPDEPTRAAILGKVREVYGAERVVDQLGVGPLVAPPNWSGNVQKLITPDLKRVTQGQLKINGNVVEVQGNVDNEALRQQLVSKMVTQLGNPTYTVRNGLRVGAAEQEVLDAALANRTIAFEPGNARLTAAGTQVLDELLPVLRKFGERRFEIVGHTDADGLRENNIVLSAARANAVKAYLAAKGVPAAQISTLGAGPDKPVADNKTAEGRAKNRRIEFRVLA